MVNEKDILGVINFIKSKMNKAINKYGITAEKVFYNGDCGNFYELLKTAFQEEAQPYIIFIDGNPYHVVTKIGEKYYDAIGEITLEKYKDFMQEHNGYSKGLNYELRPVDEKDKNLLGMRNQYEYLHAYDEDWGEYTEKGYAIKDTIQNIGKAIEEVVNNKEKSILEQLEER